MIHNPFLRALSRFNLLSARSDIVVLGYYVGSNVIGAARSYSWALWFAGAGKHTVIISGPFRSISSNNPPFLRHISLPSPLFRVGRLINHFLALLVRNLYLSSLLSTGKLGFLSLNFKHSSCKKKSSLPRGSRTGLFSYRMPCISDLWYPFSLIRLLILRPSIVVASHSPYVTFLVAYTYKRINPSSKLVVDYRDMWTLSRVYSGLPGVRRLERSLERLVLESADKIVVVSYGQASSLSSTISPCVIHNSSNIEIFTTAKSQNSPVIRSSKKKFSLLYAGTLYPAFQDPEPILKAIYDLHQASLICPKTFSFDILSSQIHDFTPLVDRYSLSEYVNLSPLLRREECLLKMQDANCFLLLENSLSESQGVMTSKLYDYLYVGRPILIDGISPCSELYCYASANGYVLGLESFSDLVCSFYAGDSPSVSSFSQADLSRRSLLALYDDLLSTFD